MVEATFGGNNSVGSMSTIEDLAKILAPEAREMLLDWATANESGLIQQRVERLALIFGGVAKATGKLIEAFEERREGIEEHLEKSRQIFDPNHGESFSDLTNARGYGSLEFIRGTGAIVHNRFEPVYRKLFLISELYNEFIKQPESGMGLLSTNLDLIRYGEAVEKIVSLTSEQIRDGIHGYEKVVTAAYTAIQLHHKTLRRKYQGLGEEPDHGVQSIFNLILGNTNDGNKEQESTGPKIELIDGNCVLTDTLMDIVDNLPKHYESVVPTGRNGRTKVIRKLDEYDVQNAANVLIHIANPTFMSYLKDPNLFPASIAESLQTFHSHYSVFEELFRDIEDSVKDFHHISLKVLGEGYDKPIPDPPPVIDRLQAMNFLSIIPTSDEIQPTSKVEKDYASARTKLLDHLNGTLEIMVAMHDGENSKEDVAIKAVRTAITLKESMDDIMKTEREKKLRQDIMGENEFFVGRTGYAGIFESEREPAPTIRYNDVKGASFDTAKAHFEEVIDLAAYPHLIKATAPTRNYQK